MKNQYESDLAKLRAEMERLR
jgi:chromosome segregation ATPase